MVSSRRLLGSLAAGATSIVLATMLTGSASASPAPRCQGDENAGANGRDCVDRIDDALGVHVGVGARVGTGLHLGAIVNVPSCPDATALLVQARLVVTGVNGKSGTSQQLTTAREDDKSARVKLKTDLAADKTEDTDYGTPHFDTQDSILAEDISERDQATEALAAANARKDDGKPVTDSTSKAYAVDKQTKRLSKAQTAIAKDQGLDAAEDGIGTDEVPQDAEDKAVASDRAAIDGKNGTAARLTAAEDAEGAAEQAVINAEVVIGQACHKTPPPPPVNTPPVLTPPAPIENNNNTIINVPGQPPAAGSSTVETHLPVTG